MKRIPIPDASFSEIDITLDGQQYTFLYRYNERSGRWKLDIKDLDKNYIVKGLTLIEEFSPNAHLNFPGFPDCVLYVGSSADVKKKCTRDNVGLGRLYELTFTNREELSAS